MSDGSTFLFGSTWQRTFVGAPLAAPLRGNAAVERSRQGPGSGTGDRRPARLAVLLSGTGRTLENLLEVTARGELAAEVVAVVSSVPAVRGLQVARQAGLPSIAVRRRDFESDDAFSAAIYFALRALFL